MTASHPTYCIARYNFIDGAKYKFTEFVYSFYHKKGASIVARFNHKNVHFSHKDFHIASTKRELKLNNFKRFIKPTDNEFDFALPHMVGKNSKKLVFLGNLHEDKDDNTILWCDGLATLPKSCISHPYHANSGDHVISAQISDILYQFSHLIVRNAHKFKYLRDIIISKYGNSFDADSIVTVGYIETNYKQRLELDIVYQVRLMNIECVDHPKYPFVIQIKVNIVQHGIKTSETTLKIYPVFLRSHL